MKIHADSNGITLSVGGEYLNAALVGQLHFWGFRQDPEGEEFTCLTENAGACLVKLTEYLRSSGVQFDLSEMGQRLLAAMSASTSEFTALVTRAAQYKNGQVDQAALLEFAGFARSHLARELREHQLKAAFHLTIVGNGANFSVPGSGKTSVVLTYYEWLRQAGKINTLVVVGPPSCFGPWKWEYRQTLGRDPRTCVLAGGDQTQRKTAYFRGSQDAADLYLTTFQTLLNDLEELIVLLSARGISTLLVVDEAHYVKQINGAWASAVLRISKYASYRCVLTGTPMPRSYSDVFNLLDFLWPQTPPLSADMKLRIQVLEQEHRSNEVKKILDKYVGPLAYRVRKSELRLTEPVFHPPIMVEMKDVERKLYDAVYTRIREYAREDYLVNIDVVRRLCRGRLTRLRQCVSYAKLLQSSLLDYDEELVPHDSDLYDAIYSYDTFETPAKIDALTEIVHGIRDGGQKVVIWSNFRGSLRLIADSLSRDGHRCGMIYGDTPIEATAYSDEMTREQIRDEFVREDSGMDVLIANPAACAESISLHKTCHNAIYYDLSYNCAQYLQSLDRIHRVGGSETSYAHYYFLQYSNSVDQDILANVREKAQRMSDIIDQDFPVYGLDMFDDAEGEAAYDRLFRQ